MRLLTIVVLLVLAGCSRTLVNYESSSYVVRPGDTLYSIAWRHGVDAERLARWNGLRDPNLIQPGQRLLVRPRAVGASAPRTQTATAPRSATAAVTRPPDSPPAWQWPTRGPVVSTYGSTGELLSGIGIAGTEGQSVVAAAAGRVVYAGSGLIGYGQLIIIKHNDTYLSAYGHNRRLLVTQGQDVSRGEPIAEMGLGPGRMPRLHFEIRRNGSPIDPLGFLRASS